MFYIIIKTGACAVKEIQRQTGLAADEFELISVHAVDWGTKENPQIAEGVMKAIYKETT